MRVALSSSRLTSSGWYTFEKYRQAGEVGQDEGGDVPGAGRPVVRGESTVACVAVPARPEIDTCEKVKVKS